MSQSTEKDPLKPKQPKAIESLLAGKSFDEASQEAGVDRRTLSRWMKEDGFTRALAQAQTDIVRASLRRFTVLFQKSVDLLDTLLSKEKIGQDDLNKLRVIQTVQSNYPRVHEIVTLEDRLDEIERLLK